jgi:hypothetical protein
VSSGARLGSPRRPDSPSARRALLQRPAHAATARAAASSSASAASRRIAAGSSPRTQRVAVLLRLRLEIDEARTAARDHLHVAGPDAQDRDAPEGDDLDGRGSRAPRPRSLAGAPPAAVLGRERARVVDLGSIANRRA